MSYRRFLLVLAGLLTVLASLVCWQGLMEHFSTLDSVGQYRSYHHGKQFTIDLANPSTGYTWQVSQANSENLRFAPSYYQAYPVKAGNKKRGGFRRITGSIVADGWYQFQLTYAQNGSGEKKAVVYQVTLLSQKQEIKELDIKQVYLGDF